MSVMSQSTGHLDGGQVVAAELDLSALGAALWRKKWKILIPTILAALVTIFVVESITPRYLSESRVFIEGRDNIYLRPDADKDNSDRSDVDEQGVTSQAQIILSRDLASQVIDKLKLGERTEFDPTLKGTSRLSAIISFLELRNTSKMTSEERVLAAYFDRLSVSPVEKSRIINIDFLSEDPELAARVANAIAEAYLERQRAAKREQARSAAEYLSGEIESMRKKVADAEAKAEAFRAKSNLLVGTNNTTLSAQQLGDFNTQLAGARAQEADAEAKAGLIRDMLRSGQPIESSDILNSELIRRLSEQRVTLRAQLAEQSSTLLDGHPRIKELKAQIADLDQQIRNEAATVARSLENDAKLASARVNSLSASFDQLKNQAATTNGDDVQLRALDRDAKSQRDLLESYLAKYREAMARDTLNSSPADARVISRATISSVPAYPKKLPTVLIAAFTTMLLAAGFVITKELLDSPIKTVPARFVPRSPAAETLLSEAAARAVGQSTARSALAVPASVITEVADGLRHTNGTVCRIAVIGIVRGLDTSGAAIKLARALAENARVVLVGLDLEDAKIKSISTDPSASGLAELAAGSSSFGDIITKDKLSRLHLISSGWTPIDRIALLSSPGVGPSFDALARSYDYVVVNAGAIADPEIEAVSEIAPHCVLVAETAATSATLSARERLLAAGFDDVTVIVAAAGSSHSEKAAAA
jgi:polysaccharide biosynthesis transport protein